MFARVSTYQPGPDSSGAPSEDTVSRVLQLPGCLGIYYLLGKDNKSLSITLWEDQEALSPAVRKLQPKSAPKPARSNICRSSASIAATSSGARCADKR